MRVDGRENSALAHLSVARETSSTSSVQVGSRDEFLRLFVAQLENQNPLEPQTGAEFVAQLAQFASVEQATATNDKLDSLYAEQVAASTASLAGFVGRSAKFSTDRIRVENDGGTMPEITAEFSEPATSAKVVIRDATGRAVRTLDLGALQAGETALTWDGRDSDGIPVSAGEYTIDVEAEKSDGSSLAAKTQLRGVITGVDFSSGTSLMRIGRVAFAPAEIISIF